MSISQACSILPINNGTNSTAYIILTYNSSLVSVGVSSLCVFQTTTSCLINSASSSLVFDKINSLIPSISTSSVGITASLYSYFSAKNSYYPTCSSSLSVSLNQQSFTPTTTLTSCNNQVLGSNNLQITFTGQSITSGDYLYIKNLLGNLNTSPIIWSYDNVTASYRTLVNSTFLTSSALLVSLNFSLSYMNPTYTSTNSLMISLYRNGIQYGSGLLSVCDINRPYVKSSILSIPNASTYAQNKYAI